MKTLRVIIAEDEILIRKHVAAVLNQLGCTVTGETASGEEAVTLVKNQIPDLVLMDIQLEGLMTGIDAAKEIGRQSPVPILFMSAYNYEDRVKQEHIPNTIGYLRKPVEDYSLGTYIKKLNRPT